MVLTGRSLGCGVTRAGSRCLFDFGTRPRAKYLAKILNPKAGSGKGGGMVVRRKGSGMVVRGKGSGMVVRTA